MALEDVAPSISVARKVMTCSRHCQLVGDGARKFALAHGFHVCDLLIRISNEYICIINKCNNILIYSIITDTKFNT